MARGFPHVRSQHLAGARRSRMDVHPGFGGRWRSRPGPARTACHRRGDWPPPFARAICGSRRAQHRAVICTAGLRASRRAACRRHGRPPGDRRRLAGRSRPAAGQRGRNPYAGRWRGVARLWEQALGGTRCWRGWLVGACRWCLLVLGRGRSGGRARRPSSRRRQLHGQPAFQWRKGAIPGHGPGGAGGLGASHRYGAAGASGRTAGRGTAGVREDAWSTSRPACSLANRLAPTRPCSTAW